MPSSPKLFYARPSSYSRSSTALVLCLLIGLSGLVFEFIAISRHSLGHDCKLGKPLSVSLRWEKTGDGSPDEGPERHKAMGFVGIQTGFGSAGRRGAFCRTWFPSDNEGLKRRSLIFNHDASKMSELKKEVAKYDDFLLLDIEEEYSKLPYKTLAISKVAYALYDSDFYVKADDDIYLRPDRVSLLLAKDRSHSLTYLGCMKKGPVSLIQN